MACYVKSCQNNLNEPKIRFFVANLDKILSSCWCMSADFDFMPKTREWIGLVMCQLDHSATLAMQKNAHIFDSAIIFFVGVLTYPNGGNS